MRRFIAGAICPECRALDRIVVEASDGGRRRRCVECGHSEAMVDSATPEPATRLDTRASPPTPVQVVRLLDPNPEVPDKSAEKPSN
jgi:hypothetical protein